MKKYDYIFIGAGCAGLSLLTRIIAAGLTAGKRILLIDRAPKQKNDRTWCFWEKESGFFEPVVCKQWNHLWFYADSYSKQFSTAPYQYKMIRGIDFYNHCFNLIQQHSNIETLFGEVSDVFLTGSQLQLKIAAQSYTFESPVVFNSIYKEEITRRQSSVYLLQHFKGWTVETTQPFFNKEEATLMDFRVPQINGATFAYVLPLSDKKALVEYTLFSEKILPENEYDDGLKAYVQQFLQLKDYRITEEEFGIIPMTNAGFPWYAEGMYHIGTAGGQTKGSSGYTFQFIQKQSKAIVAQLQANTLHPSARPGVHSSKFNFYDNVLLQVLAKNYATGSDVFSSLFKKNSPAAIFSFLDNESSLMQDISIIQTLPIIPFVKAAIRQLLRR